MEKCNRCHAVFEAPINKDFEAHYCPNCGVLLAGKAAIDVVENDYLEELKYNQAPKAPDGKIFIKRDEAMRNLGAYNNMIKNGYAPMGKVVINEDEYKQLKNTTQLLEEWKRERDRLRRTPVYRDVNHFTWDFYLGTALASFFMISGLVFLFAIIPWIWTHLNKDSKELIEIVKDDSSGKYGIYDNERDSLVVPYQYDTIIHRKGYNTQSIYYNLFYLHKDKKIAVADSLGRITVSCDLDSTVGACDNLMIMYKGEKQGLVDYFGHPIIPCEYKYVLWERKPEVSTDSPGSFVGNIIPVKKDNSGWELYNRKGDRINGKSYYAATQTGVPNLIKVWESTRLRNNGYYTNKCGVVDENGQEVIPCKYYRISRFEDNRAWVQESSGEAWSLISTTNKLIKTLPKTYSPHIFSEGLAAVKNKQNGKIGYYDISGNLIIPMKYGLINGIDPSFVAGTASVSLNGTAGTIDKNGQFTPDANNRN